MLSRFEGRQTQFYIDVVYGVAFAAGFAYLLFVGMDPRVAAFQGGLVFGYFLRVWENMSIYERVLEEEVAAEAEAQVGAELEDQVPGEVESKVTEELEDQVPDEVADQVTEELEDQVPGEVESRVSEEVETQVVEELEATVTELLEEADSGEELVAELRERLDDA